MPVGSWKVGNYIYASNDHKPAVLSFREILLAPLSCQPVSKDKLVSETSVTNMQQQPIQGTINIRIFPFY